MFDCYNRTQPEFMLRARLPASGEEVSFRLANPSPVARSAWTSTPSPTVLRGPECEVELVSFFEYGEPGRNRWRERYDVTSNPDSEQINSAFEVYSLGWQDDIGNDMQGYHGGCPVHPDAKLMKIEFDVGKSNFYKRNFSALPPFASFAWPVTIGGHASTNMVLGAEANRRYFEGVRVRITKRKDGFSCEFEAHSMHPKANLNGLLDLCLFVESDPTHCFFPDGRNSGSHRSKGELFTSAEGRWRVSLDDMPNVGERVTLFVHPGREARGPYSFVVPCEAIVGVRDARSR